MTMAQHAEAMAHAASTFKYAGPAPFLCESLWCIRCIAAAYSAAPLATTLLSSLTFTSNHYRLFPPVTSCF